MPRGGFGGGFGRGAGRGFAMRRSGAPLMGGYGMGMGSPLISTLMAGGVGYALGSNSSQQGAQQAPSYQQPYPYQTPPAPYQAPPAAPQVQGAGADSRRLAQLKLLGELHESGVLTDDEFERQKQQILGS